MSQMTTLSKTRSCRYCGKQIAFIKTEAGKTMPVNPEPIQFLPEDEKQKFVLMDGTVKRGTPKHGDELDAQRYLLIGYQSHFATCPYADEARKKNKSERTRKHE